MAAPIVDQVVDFYSALFGDIFSASFQQRITDRLKQKAVLRQIEEAADAASQSLIRFYLNERLPEQQVANILYRFSELSNLLKRNDITNPNIARETIVETLLGHLSCPESVQEAGQAAIYRISLHSIVQVLMLVGPVMAEWQKLNFSSTFELPRRVVNRLNQISEQLGALGRAGQTAADDAYELSYRDYLLQRFHRIEAGTVRMTTNLDVDLRELFIMPQLLVQSSADERSGAEAAEAAALMNLAAARELFGGFHEQRLVPEKKRDKHNDD